MSKTEVQTRDIKDGEVKRDDLNVLEVGQAVVRKVLAGDGIAETFTGADQGTGDVVIRVKDKRELHFVLLGKTVTEWLDLVSSGFASNFVTVQVEKTFYVKKVYFTQKAIGSAGQVCRLNSYSVPNANLANVSTADTLEFSIDSNSPDVILNIGDAKAWIWSAPDETRVLVPGRRYAFLIDRLAGTAKWEDPVCTIELEEVVP